MAENTAEVKKENKIGYTILGILVIILAIIGLFSVISSIINITKNIINDTSKKDELAEYIYPLVLIDAPSFDSIDALSDSTVLNAAIWDIILAEENDNYIIEDNNYIVPAVDVEKSVSKLFGEARTVNHQTVGDLELTFTYNEETASYKIPLNIFYYPYYPYIESFVKKGNTYTLNVGYVPPGNHLKESIRKPKIQKYMTYVIEINGNNKVIKSVSIDDTNGGRS